MGQNSLIKLHLNDNSLQDDEINDEKLLADVVNSMREWRERKRRKDEAAARQGGKLRVSQRLLNIDMGLCHEAKKGKPSKLIFDSI